MCHAVGTVPRNYGSVKLCYTCRELLPLDAFAPSVARRRQGGFCKQCRAAYGRLYYHQNKEICNQRRLINQRRYRVRNHEGVNEYLSRNPCIDCGEADVRVLEFDHVRGKKEGNIGDLVRDGLAWQRIVSEIAKCEVRCANCHRRKTVEQFGWR